MGYFLMFILGVLVGLTSNGCFILEITPKDKEKKDE